MDIETVKSVLQKSLWAGMYGFAAALAVTQTMSIAELQMAFAVAFMRGIVSFVLELSNEIPKKPAGKTGVSAKTLGFTSHA